MANAVENSNAVALKRSRGRAAIAAGLLVAGILAAYWPALRAGFIWDDDGHVTKPALQSWGGLGRIWFEVGATQQYYPLLHTLFWIEHRLWGDAPLGYHLANVALHAAVALLVMAAVRRLLAMRGLAFANEAAFLTAAVFALHPVQVESVAWITEQKNTLSALFYLAALLAYLRFDESRRRGAYAAALLLFVLGLLSKTVTATLPGALLVIFWWLRGRIDWKRDVLPLVPFFVIGAAAGLFTARVEHDLIGARGKAFELGLDGRLLLSGRVVWFYLCKLLWPAELVFVYPRWTIDSRVAWQYGYPAGLVAFVALLWLVARRHRAPLAGFLFFVGSLFPVLGFFNVYPFLYSFVADHFQYLACLGVIAVLCGFAAAGLSRLPAGARGAVLIAIPLALGVLSNRQARMYADGRTLYEATLARNPDCWMALNNLGVLLKNAGQPEAALAKYQRALELRPDYPEALDNTGLALSALGRTDEAIAAHQRALRLRLSPEILANLGNAYASAGRHGEAVAALQKAATLDRGNARLQANLGVALEAAGRPGDAAATYRQALQLDSQLPDVRARLELVSAAAASPAQAMAAYERILRDQPDNAAAHFSLAVVLAQQNRMNEAIPHYEQTLRLNADHVEAHNNLAALLAKAGRLGEALPHFEAAVRLRPNQAETHMNLAVAYSQSGRKAEALGEAQRARALVETQPEMRARIDAWIAANGAAAP